MELHQTKMLCTTKVQTINKTKMQLTEWEKIFANDLSNWGYHPKYIKNSCNTSKKQTIQFTKEPKVMNRHFSKRHTDGQWAHEETFNHQGNANQNHNEITSSLKGFKTGLPKMGCSGTWIILT